jgi:hypothetical protein
MIDDVELIDCDIHGKQQQTFVCCHTVDSLKDNQPRGFWWSVEQPENPRPDAWCSECENLVNKHGEWEGEAEDFADIRIICGSCYDNAKVLNFPVKNPWWKFW